MAAAGSDRRARGKAETRRRIQEHALRLFEEQGFDNTTVEQVASAAGVSHMTVFRHFATKDDLIGEHEYGIELKRLIAARPRDEDPILRVRRGIRDGLARIDVDEAASMRRRTRLMLSAPSLLARRLLNQAQREAEIAEALADGPTLVGRPFAARVLAAACVGAMNVAFVEWVDDHTAELPALMDAAFDTLRTELANRSGTDGRDGSDQR